jgi:hypothetical protein
MNPNQIIEIKKIVERILSRPREIVLSADIQPNAVKQRHIDGLIVFRGVVADRPADGETEIQVYYAEDEKKLYIWNTVNEAWEYSSFT